MLQINRPRISTRTLDAECPIHFNQNGQVIKPMYTDYGFRSGTRRLYQEDYGKAPKGVWQLASENFAHELRQLRQNVRYNPYKDDVPSNNAIKRAVHNSGVAICDCLAGVDKWLEEKQILPELVLDLDMSEWDSEEFKQVKSQLDSLTLSVATVERIERERIQKHGDMQSSAFVKAPFYALCWALDTLYDNKPIQKFWVLETVARIPYFAYISTLHLYESLGFWRAGASLRRVHFAEEWNELHHLQIMESLGGDRLWFDRFLAEHAAVFYYWIMVVYYLASPTDAYNFMQRVEHHAADTYAAFLEDNRPTLESIAPPIVALNYYLGSDLYLFDEFQTESKTIRRPKCETLYDVFVNIKDDENEHVKTMIACQAEK